MDAEYLSYAQYMSKARLDKAINSLLGLVEGVSIDGQISPAEVDFFRLWLQDHQAYRSKHPFTELVPLVEQAVADGVLDEEERADIKWLCEKLRSERYFDATTADLQRLHAVMGKVSLRELPLYPELAQGFDAGAQSPDVRCALYEFRLELRVLLP
jgi:hypothetical protein